MNKKAIEIQKTQAIIEEVEASFKFISAGLKSLKEQTAIVSNNHVPLQLLSSGFERILKILLLIKDKYENGKFPEFQISREWFKNYDNGHGIGKMLDALIVYANTADVMQKKPMVIEDIEHIKTDLNFREFIKIITEFSKQQRYYYIDTIILENQNKNENPFSQFKEFISSFDEGVDVAKQSYDEEDALKIKNAIICIEKGVIAITRFFTHGFGDLGKKYYGNFYSFIFLNNEDLGSLNYAEKKKPLSDNYKALSPVPLEFLNILSNAKVKTIHSSEHVNWPFTIDSVQVFSLNGRFFIAKIGDEIFALTGKTSTNYEIPIYNVSSKLKPRQYATFLLAEAKQLK